MKKTLLLIALVFGAGSMTFAQTNKTVNSKKETAAATITPAQHIDKRVQNMTKNLNLTTQQQASIKQIMTNSQTALESAKQANDKEKGQQIKKDMHNQILAQLTPDQKMKFEKYLAKKNQKGGDAGQAPRN